jgi:hypothetical protein
MLGTAKDIQLLTTLRRRADDFVQDTESCQRPLDIAALADADEGVRQGLDDLGRGRTRLAKGVFEEIRRKHGIHR